MQVKFVLSHVQQIILKLSLNKKKKEKKEKKDKKNKNCYSLCIIRIFYYSSSEHLKIMSGIITYVLLQCIIIQAQKIWKSWVEGNLGGEFFYVQSLKWLSHVDQLFLM